MNTQYEDQLAVAPIVPLIFRMAIPSVIAQFINLLYSIVDRIYIGHMPNMGTEALAGIGITGSIIILISSFSSFVNGGGAPLAAISLGANKRDQAHQILGNGFVILICFTCITSFTCYTFMEPILRLIGASDTTMRYASDYLSIYLMGTLFVQLTTGLNAFITCQGRPGISMCSVIIGAILNIILDPIFIFGFNMGVKGAALATIISQFFSCMWVLSFLFSKRASLRLMPKYMKPNRKIIASIFTLGIGPFIMASTESLIGFVLNGGLAKFGDIYVSALTIMQSCMQMVSVPLIGFCQGFAPIISYNYGHKNPERIKECFKVTLISMCSFMLVTISLMMCFPTVIASLFTKDAMLLEVIGQYMPIFLSGMTIFGLQRACQHTFVALGQSKVSLFIALLRKVILLVPLALILPNFLGVKGIYAAEAISDATAAILCFSIFLVQFPKILQPLKEQKENI